MKMNDMSMIKLTSEQWQIIYSALKCASKESAAPPLTAFLVNSAKDIVGLHMNGQVETEVFYNDGVLSVMDSTNWKEE